MTSRSKKLLVVMAIVAVGAVAFLWRRSPSGAPERGFIVDMVAVDGDTAVLVWRANYTRGPSRGWVSSIDGHGRTRWVRELPAVPFTGRVVIVHGGVVTVRYGHQEDFNAIDHSVAAYALEDGRPLWDKVLTPYHSREIEGHGRTEAGLPVYQSGIGVGDDRIAFWADDGLEPRLYVVNATTGDVVSQQPSSRASRAAIVLGTRVIDHGSRDTAFYDLATGTATHVETDYEGCVIGDEYVTVQSIDDEPALVAFRGGDPSARRVIARPFRPIGDPEAGWPLLRRCGRHGDQMVLLLQSSVGRDLPDQRTDVVTVDRDGKVIHTIDLEQDTLWVGSEAVPQRAPLNAPLGGELPRFVPYVQHTVREPESRVRLVMLDLELGTIAWSAPENEEMIHASVFHAGGNSYVFHPYPDYVLTAFDGATGEIASAVKLYDYNGIRSVQPDHVAGGRVWVDGGTWTPFAAPPIAVLDAVTLAPQFVRGLELEDVTAHVKTYFGRERR